MQSVTSIPRIAAPGGEMVLEVNGWTVVVRVRRAVSTVSAGFAVGTPIHMPTTKPNIVVEPRPDGRWARQKNGTRRAASLHDTQAAAETAARAQAKRERAELVVKGRDGKIQRRDSYGNDPRSIPG
jgi:hypothetical protein